MFHGRPEERFNKQRTKEEMGGGEEEGWTAIT